MTPVDQRCMRKILIRFLPLLLICYVVAHLDRVNVGYAALTMNQDIGLTTAAFGLGAGLFFITYFAFEIPSNLALERFGARRWIARIMLTWGLLSGATAFVQGETGFYVVRLLLGAAEAGFFPGIIFFLTLWVPGKWRATFVGSFMVAIPLASVVGAPVSAFLINSPGFWGLKSWQTMFLIEAVPAIFLAFVVLRVLRDTPDQAEWLDPEEKRWLQQALAAERQQANGGQKEPLVDIMTNPRVWLLAFVYFGITGFSYGMAFFLPLILKDANLSVMQTGVATALPFAVGAIGMVVWGRRSDRLGERRQHVLIPLMLAVVGLAASTMVPSPWLKIVLISVSAFGVMAALPVFWTLPPLLFGASIGAGGIAMINSLGNISGFAHSLLMGVIRDKTGSYTYGLILISVVGVCSFIVLLVLTRKLSSRPVNSDYLTLRRQPRGCGSHTDVAATRSRASAAYGKSASCFDRGRTSTHMKERGEADSHAAS